MNKSKSEVVILPQYSSACGIDMHKDTIMLYFSDKDGHRIIEKQFGTVTRDLKKIVKLLMEEKVDVILLESTGIYWISLYHLMTEQCLNVIVANPSHIKQLPKQKTDKKDARWLCKLAINNMVRHSFIPDKTQHELREYCRLREKYNKQVTSTQNRIVKIIERANIKIRSVSSSIRTKSCQLIISALVEGITDPKQLAQLCKGRLRPKIPEMEVALEGKLTNSDKDILKMMKQDLDHINKQLEKIEEKIKNLVDKRYKEQSELLKRVSGVGGKTSQSILAEVGVDMNKFQNADHLTAWAGLAPGNHESAKKRKQVKSRKGNIHLKTTMVRVGWSAVRTKGSYWSCIYSEMIKRMKPQKAIVAIARRMLKLMYKILDTKYEYQEGGVELYLKHKENRILYLTKIKQAS